MLFNISHNDKKTTQKINDLVGKSFSFLENIKLKGIGSPRLIITKSSSKIEAILNKNNAIKYANIELRPQGIIIGFQSQLEVYALVIPFYKLVTFKPGNSITFHVDEHFISIDCSKNYSKIASFLAKVDSLKMKQDYEFIN
jgi:hypothetical protein